MYPGVFHGLAPVATTRRRVPRLPDRDAAGLTGRCDLAVARVA